MSPAGRDPTPEKRYVLIGDPVAKSLSPAFQNAGLGAAGIHARYEAIRVTTGELARQCEALRTTSAGYNITVPHKRDMLPLLDALTPEAEAIGAVNTVEIRAGGRTLGHNTDWSGFLRALGDLGVALRPDLRCVVLGSGGSARAVLYALRGKSQLCVVSRDPEAARELHTLVPDLELTAYDDARETLASADLLVNAVPMAAGTARAERALGDARPRPGAVGFDLSYLEGGDTPFVAWMRGMGVRSEDGKRMLVYQGAASFRIWTGREMPLGPAFEALGLSSAT